MRCFALILVCTFLAALTAHGASAAGGTARVSGVVWLDSDSDGIRDRGETGVRAVTVRIERRSGKAWRRVSILKSSFSGTWSKSRLRPGIYRIRVTRPATAERFSARARGKSRSTDSDVGSSGVSAAAKLRSGRTVRLDVGLIAKPSGPVGGAGPMSTGGGPGGDTTSSPLDPVAAATVASGLVWDDLNNDGQRADSEPKFSGITIEAWDATRTAAVASTTTDVAGRWRITLASPGDYMIRLVLPSGTIYAQNDVGDDTRDSDVNDDGDNAGFSDPIRLEPGETPVGAGVRSNTASITIGDKAWKDADADGIQDASETSFSYVDTIELWNDSFTQRISATSTTTQSYSLQAKAGGAYRVRASFLPGYSCTIANAASDSLDSDLVPDRVAPCRSATIRPSASITSLDIGGVPTASIGNLVWQDTVVNNRQDPGEPGIAGVKIELWNSTRTVLWQETFTNSSGFYTLTSPHPGAYQIRVYPPAGFILVPPNAGGDDQKDSDAISVGTNAGWTTDDVVIANNTFAAPGWDFGMRLAP